MHPRRDNRVSALRSDGRFRVDAARKYWVVTGLKNARGMAFVRNPEEGDQ